ncbi:Ketoacyl-synthetase C-terminal extension [Paenibacillus tianmuensis]|uniref:Ketoacyl-synthetase C-terminal extension n=1 Tax=Paenibacillus tianmuensis TaxID=624147 RepID=A0A1G4QZ98_9BACL|nr:beta-ketoacyl synthase N-terminal-like domain-containing protein [Paenibacillus tianmuensis]SCW49973.1 Ketoacyl-synthetase C-terminal extension [Paenibacillus tianmuensis]
MDFMRLSSIRNSDEPDIEIKEANSKDIAVIGISGQMSMADHLDQYWENILNKIECVKEFSATRKQDADRYLTFKGMAAEELSYYDAAFLDRIDQFDPRLFHLTPKEAKVMDPKQKLFLMHTWNAIEDAGYSLKEITGQRIGVYTGLSDFGSETYFDMLTHVDPGSIEIGSTGNFQAIIPTRISYLLDLKGPSMVVDTACSSSLVTVHLACRALRNKECDAAIVGSVRLHLLPLQTNYRIGFESKDGRTKAFDDTATGTGVGEGAVVVMLKPLQKAKADGDHIYAVIKGTAINQDGNSIGITAPNADAQADVIERAWKDAGVSAEDISYMETHGTGTRLGDPIEIDGINKVFSRYTSKKQFCAIGSVKSNIGHLYEAAGLASLVKCIYALNERIIPPSINYHIPNRAIDFHDSPVYVNVKTREWNHAGGKRICGVSSFGLSGTNCHLILEEPETRERPAIEEQGPSVLTLSGKAEGIVKELVDRYLTQFQRIRAQHPKDVCYTAAVGRHHYKHRVAIVFSTYDQLFEALREISETPLAELNHASIYYNDIEGNHEPDLVGKINTLDLNAPNQEEDLRQLALAYVHHLEIQWADLYGSAKRKRARLPSWVFELERYWIDVPQAGRRPERADHVEEWAEEHREIVLDGRTDGSYSATERKLGAIVKEVMGYDQINIYENFYELGGDSLLAMKAYTKINEWFQVNISAADIFSYPSIALLSQYIDKCLSKSEASEWTVPADRTPAQDAHDEFAIIGMAGKFPLADHIEQYWENICGKVNCVRDIPANRREDLKNYIRQLGYDENDIQFAKAGYLQEIDKFDYEFFGLTLKEATLMDPAQRCFLEVVYEMAEEAGYGGNRLVGSNTGVFVGYIDEYLYNYRRFIYDSDPSLTKYSLSGNLSANISARISYSLDLRGPSVVLDTSCSSSLVALNAALKSLKTGECDTAIVGSAKIKLIPIHNPESRVGVESEHAMIRAFDDDADGIAEGEAVAAIMIKPLKKAMADGDYIRAVIKGSAVNQDGTGMGIMAPRSETQTQVILDAWKDAGIDPASITYIETHGTGTKLGDLVEYDGLKKAFGKYTNEKQYIALGSVKTNLGHVYQASGLASVIKAVLSLQHKKLVPSLHFDRPNRLIDFEESPFYFNNILRDWETHGIPRRCGVSSFGFSGTNGHVVLEEYDENDQEQQGATGPYIVTLSGKSKEVLHNLVRSYLEFLEQRPDIDMGRLSFTTNAGRGHYNERLALIVKDQDDLKHKLNQLLLHHGENIRLEDIYYGTSASIPRGSVREESRIHEMTRSPAGLKQICLSYAAGADIPWDKLYEEHEKHVLPLPTYPFMRKRCWFQPKARNRSFSIVEEDVVNDYELLELEQQHRRRMETEVAAAGAEAMSGLTEIEHAVIQAFKEVLGIKQVRLEDHFFELGGNSLKATKLASKIYQLLEVLMPLSDILIYPSVRDFVNHIEQLVKDNKTMTRIPVLPEQEFYDLTVKQKDLWLSTQLYEDTSAMNITSGWLLEKVDIALLLQAFWAVVERHPILKTRVVIEDGEPRQTLDSGDTIARAYHYLDLSGSEGIEESLERLKRTEVKKPIHLERDPLIRLTMANIGQERHFLVFVIHHIISDWWSIDLIMNDLVKYYNAFSSNTAPQLEPLSVKFSDIVAWHKEKMETDKEKLECYWNGILQGPLPVMNLRTDFERPLQKDLGGKRLDAKFDMDVMGRLKHMADVNQGTMFMTVLSGVFSLLHLYSGQNDMIVGINSSGREHYQLQDQVGYFVNVLPLRIQIDSKDTYIQLFGRVRQQSLGALEHQDYPLVLMMDNEHVVRDQSRSPIFDVLAQFIIDPSNDDSMRVNHGCIREIPIESLESKYDLVFNFFERRGEITLELEYSDSLFKEETMERMIARLKRIFEQYSNNAQLTVRELQTEESPYSRISPIQKRKRG